MPALIHQSAALASRKLVLISQSMVEQSNGLVEVAVQYVALASSRNTIMPLFKTDAQPPIHPSIIDLDKLQTRRLYLRDFNSTQANGMLELSAVYVGASYQGILTPFVFTNVESQSIGLNIPVALVGIVVTAAFYTLDCAFRVEEHSAAVIGDELIVFPAPEAFTTPTRTGLVSGAIFAVKEDVIAKGVLSGPLFRGQRFPGADFIGLTASEILNKIAEPLADGTSGLTVEKAINTQYITPTVRILENTYRLQVNIEVLRGPYLITEL